MRQAVVNEARSWIGTPYVRGGRIKGVGCDCATLLLAVYSQFGLIGDEEIRLFQSDWFCHASDDSYLFRMLRYANRVAEAACGPAITAESGNAVLCRVAGSKLYNHGAIVTMWPYAIESVEPLVREVDVTRDPMWALRSVVVLDPFIKVRADGRT